jgi:hypothetical protein
MVSMSSPIQSRLLKLRYEGTCTICNASLPRRTEAWWYADKKEIVCTSCRPADADSIVKPNQSALTEAVAIEAPALTALGQAGASARRESDRRKDRREQETLKKHPRAGKLILRMTDESPATRAWGKGAGGEEALGARLTELAQERLVVLHDRRIPGSRANIDHLAVAPGGVFVIDAKHYSGRVEKRNLGNLFRSDVRLYVGRRDCTKLLHGAEDQGEVVRDVLRPAGFVDIPVRPVLCFLGAQWGVFGSPFKVGNVLVTHPKFLCALLGKGGEVETATIQDAARTLAVALASA